MTRARLVAALGLLLSVTLTAACGQSRPSSATATAPPTSSSASALTAPSATSGPVDPSESPSASNQAGAVPRPGAPTAAAPANGDGRTGGTASGPAVPTSANVVPAWIPYPDSRKDQMADYALARYGTRTWQLRPQVIVLHFTATSDDPWSTINYFASNPITDVPPGVCTHFVLAQDGTAYQLVPTDVMCRHTIGLNHVSLGIEVAQSTDGNSSQWAEDQIFDRPAQIGALVRLVKQLQAEYGIANDRVIGHGTANDDPQFLDLTGLRNDHTDWGWPSIQRFRTLLATTS